MGKYCISGASAYKDVIGGGASAKAPADVARTAQNIGYKLLFISSHEGGKLKAYLATFFNINRLLYSIDSNDEVVIQYPQYHLLFLNLMICRRFKKLKFLIHDINSVRIRGRLSGIERICLNRADEIIVHSPEMRDYLKKQLKARVSYKILGCFDYYININRDNFKRNISKDICFAGNMDKSLFLHKFIALNNRNINFHLYGLMKNKPASNTSYVYEGFFQPDNVNGLKGSWGLVWDGADFDSCGGTFGEYLSIIAPHKFSLYIVAGIPPIVWSKSAMASIVRNQQLGLCINSLRDLDEVINSVTAEEYQTFLDNLFVYAMKISSGENTRKVLK